jgi:hypothetical protein
MLPIVNHEDKHEVMAAIIIEQTMEPVKPDIIHVENSPGMFFVRFNACLQDFDVFNRNNRKYLYQPMVESWNMPHIKELIKRGDMFGESGHPITKDPMRVVTIDPKVCCHRIVGIEFKNRALYGTIETLNDDMFGKQFTKHILQGCTAAFSLRALAPLTKIDAVRVEVRSKCHVVTEDRVILPSHKNAYGEDQQQLTMIKGSTEAYNPNETIAALESYGNVNEPNVNLSYAAESSLVNYLVNESHNISLIVDHYEVAYENAYLSSDKKNVILEEKADATGGKKSFVVSLENYVKDEVSEILRSWQ